MWRDYFWGPKLALPLAQRKGVKCDDARIEWKDAVTKADPADEEFRDVSQANSFGDASCKKGGILGLF